MEVARKIYEEVLKLPEDEQKEILDFIEFKKMKYRKELEKIIDKVIEKNFDILKELADR
ncbi:hypothetical protein Calkr_0006 [Caldicellulosiruptor acetigenus I77R1B]|uniref:DUF2281 domain-containing protein n=2 Tax=Caldicellulosiruptor acetigenus TaxID=301953 RepID=G2PV14_9FIRM|nr:DUF2281 domain-containing protein [Caldicellulosiruptor acetigenus]ADQ39599.1 hypothetical protein Calkr_0006 [Caldicellulosiruptor acetigenus I77R1B]AEM72705.1 hypothetical protein Calla_0006 [Caldicellulosiruptor acetigenus 6A]WAM36255.1 DUF2281 domain-containing protein [Caldicellulosiruptor acetigenus]